MKKACHVFLLMAVAFGIAACSNRPTRALQASDASFSPTIGSVGVVMATVPKASSDFPGAACLLCLAAATAANSGLTDYIGTLPSEDVLAAREDVANALRKKGLTVKVITEPFTLDALPDNAARGARIARKDFSGFKQRYQVDRILVLEVIKFGIQRDYSSYIPTSDPRAFLRGVGYMVNLSDNTYDWYVPFLVSKGSATAWDEPPKFPGLTNAYFEVLERSKDRFLAPLNR